MKEKGESLLNLWMDGVGTWWRDWDLGERDGVWKEDKKWLSWKSRGGKRRWRESERKREFMGSEGEGRGVVFSLCQSSTSECQSEERRHNYN